MRSESAFTEHLYATLGGRAAEEIMFGELSSGALDDLEKVTKEAYMMVVFYGFNKKIGNINFYDSTGQRDIGIQKPYSEETGKLFDKELRKLLTEAYQRTNELLQTNKSSLQIVADLLVKKEVIFKEDMEIILGKRPGEKPGEEEMKEKTTATLVNQQVISATHNQNFAAGRY